MVHPLLRVGGGLELLCIPLLYQPLSTAHTTTAIGTNSTAAFEFRYSHTVYRVFFGGQNICCSAILRHFVGNIFVVGAGNGRQSRFIHG